MVYGLPHARWVQSLLLNGCGRKTRQHSNTLVLRACTTTTSCSHFQNEKQTSKQKESLVHRQNVGGTTGPVPQGKTFSPIRLQSVDRKDPQVKIDDRSGWVGGPCVCGRGVYPSAWHTLSLPSACLLLFIGGVGAVHEVTSG